MKHPFDLRGRARKAPPASESIELGIGDVVRLKSGGATMTVSALGDYMALCVWHDDGGAPCEDWYVPAALEHVGE